jgi:hypothetical protein
MTNSGDARGVYTFIWPQSAVVSANHRPSAHPVQRCLAQRDHPLGARTSSLLR